MSLLALDVEGAIFKVIFEFLSIFFTLFFLINISILFLGFWHTSNINTPFTTGEQSLCARSCSDRSDPAKCTRPRNRLPLVDFVGSDSVLAADDYNANPDLQM